MVALIDRCRPHVPVPALALARAHGPDASAISCARSQLSNGWRMRGRDSPPTRRSGRSARHHEATRPRRKPRRPTPALKLEEFLPYRLTSSPPWCAGAVPDLCRAMRIGVPEWRVLVTLGQYGVMTAKAIGTHSHMHKTKVSRAVALLERRKLVSRRTTATTCAKPFCRSRRRPRHLRGTGADRTRFRTAVDGHVDAADREALDRALRKLTERSAQLAADIADRHERSANLIRRTSG